MKVEKKMTEADFIGPHTDHEVKRLWFIADTAKTYAEELAIAAHELDSQRGASASDCGKTYMNAFRTVLLACKVLGSLSSSLEIVAKEYAPVMAAAYLHTDNDKFVDGLMETLKFVKERFARLKEDGHAITTPPIAYSVPEEGFAKPEVAS